jgi:hypothetical protein
VGEVLKSCSETSQHRHPHAVACVVIQFRLTHSLITLSLGHTIQLKVKVKVALYFHFSLLSLSLSRSSDFQNLSVQQVIYFETKGTFVNIDFELKRK